MHSLITSSPNQPCAPHSDAEGHYRQPVCVVVSTQINTCRDLADRTLHSMGILEGRALIRMHYESTGTFLRC